MADSIGTITLDGVAYTYTIRASEVSSSTAWALWIGTAVEAYGPYTSDWRAWTGTIGALTLAPNGSAYNADAATWSQQAYANNSFERTLYFQCGTTGWNVAGGIRSINIKTTAGYYQAEFEAVSGGATIPKTTDYTLYTEWVISWVSATPEFTGTIGTQAWSVGVDPSFDVATYFGDPPGPLVFSILSGSLPTGTSVNASTGVIEGTPTAVETDLCVIRCANDVGDAFTNEFSWSTT